MQEIRDRELRVTQEMIKDMKDIFDKEQELKKKQKKKDKEEFLSRLSAAEEINIK